MQRSGVFSAPTRFTAGALPKMQRQQVTLDGTVDASAIYLHDVKIGAAAHDVFFVTTTYGKTLAIDANDGSILLALHAGRLQPMVWLGADHDGDAGRRP